MKNLLCFLMLVFIISFFAACSSQDSFEGENGLADNDAAVKFESIGPEITQQSEIVRLRLHFSNAGYTEIIAQAREVSISPDDSLYRIAIENLIKGPVGNNQYKPTIPEGTRVLGIRHSENIVTVDFSEEFLSYGGPDEELIARMSVVNTLTELQGVSYVRILVNGMDIKNADGKLYGMFKRYQAEINEVAAQEEEKAQHAERENIENRNIILYFGDPYASFVIPEVREVEIRDRDYAKSVIAELIRGPRDEKLIRTIPKGTRLIDVEIIDKTALVNFSKELVENHSGGSTGESITISSIVNTLTEFSSIDKVEILIEGEKNRSIGGHFLLDRALERMESTIGKRIKLYFNDKNAEKLRPEYRAIEAGVRGVAQRAVRELINGPFESGYYPVIPGNTQLLGIWIEGETCFVNFSREIKTDHPGGSTGEAMTIFSIVNTLTEYPTISRVQILIEGRIEETLAGHVIISSPISRNEGLISE